mmetsp:Transcript_36594/g.101589  ORF Transcript_36594/g.101589 Transcript_36594/m.101589 type:complete len:112 (-) Transcript_36594:1387-1722(-)
MLARLRALAVTRAQRRVLRRVELAMLEGSSRLRAKPLGLPPRLAATVRRGGSGHTRARRLRISAAPRREVQVMRQAGLVTPEGSGRPRSKHLRQLELARVAPEALHLTQRH